MLIHARKIIGLPIIESVSGLKIDTVENIIVDPEGGKILAFLMAKSFFWEKNQIVHFKDMIEIFSDGVLVKSRDSIVESEEVFQINDILKKKIFLIGSLVLTQNGQKIGILDDFLFDTLFQKILTLTVRKRFSSEKRIIGAERILSILRKKIVIRDIILKAAMQKKLGALDRLLNTANG